MLNEIITLFGFENVAALNFIVSSILLIAVLYLIYLVRTSLPKRNNKQDDIVVQQAPQQVVSNTVAEDDSELVAAITAAIATMTGTDSNGLVIKNIKKIPDSDTTWSKVGKIELMR